MGKSSPPAAPAMPDPSKLAAQQANANNKTAITQYGLNATDQTTPWGNISYTQNGDWQFTDDKGKPYTVPRFQMNQTLTPEQQAIMNSNQKAQLNLSQTADQQSQFLKQYLSQPLDLSNDAVEGRLFDLGRKRLDPLLEQRRQGMEADLANRGIGMGTEAYNNAMQQFGQNSNDAYNQLVLSGRGQSVSEIMAQRNQPINEITALLSGTQVNQPNFQNTPNVGVAPVDINGAYQVQNQAYGNQLGAWNAQQSQQNAMMSGLFGMGAAGLGGYMRSDRESKTDISKISEVRDGLNLYSFRYKEGGPQMIGFMADEVEKLYPHAVKVIEGYKAVNYSTIAEELR